MKTLRRILTVLLAVVAITAMLPALQVPSSADHIPCEITLTGEGSNSECQIAECDAAWIDARFYREDEWMWFQDTITGTLIGGVECDIDIYQIDLRVEMKGIGGTASGDFERCGPRLEPDCGTEFIWTSSWNEVSGDARVKDTGPGNNCFEGSTTAGLTVGIDVQPGNGVFGPHCL